MPDDVPEAIEKSSVEPSKKPVLDTEQAANPLVKDPDRLNSEGEAMAKEVGGRKGPEPTRYGDWEKKGIVSDF